MSSVVQVPDDCETDLDKLYKEADKALYLAKTRKQSNDDAAHIVIRSCQMAGSG